MPKQLVFALVTFFHDLFTVIWIGGLFTLGLCVLPSIKSVLDKGPQMKKLVNAIQTRLSKMVYVSIVGLWITGMLKANQSGLMTGLLSFTTPYSTVLSLKHIVVIVMVAITLFRSLALGGKNAALTPQKEKLKMVLLFVNILLGTAVLLLSGFSVAFSAGM